MSALCLALAHGPYPAAAACRPSTPPASKMKADRGVHQIGGQAHIERQGQLSLVYDERFAPTYGPWRAVIPTVVDRSLACGLLDHGVARIRCDTCANEYLLAFSCKSRYFCPSCHAKQLARWTLWLEETLLAPSRRTTPAGLLSVARTLRPPQGRAGDSAPARRRRITRPSGGLGAAEARN